MKQSPVYALYARIAPNPDDWTLLVARTAEFLKVDYDWTAEVAEHQTPTLLVYADADSITPRAHRRVLRPARRRPARRELGRLARPANQLAVLPGTTHYDIYRSPPLVPAVLPFLRDAAQ